MIPAPPSSAEMLTALQDRFGIERLQDMISAAVVRAPNIRRMEHVANLYREHITGEQGKDPAKQQ